MSYKIQYTNQEVIDLRKLTIDILDLSKDKITALSYISQIHKKVEVLKEFPNSGSLPKDRVLISQGYRFLIYKKYLIFYTVDSSSNTVYIRAILNSKRDYAKALRYLV